MTVSCGIAFQAAAGVPRATLRSTAELALAAWPSRINPSGRASAAVPRLVSSIPA